MRGAPILESGQAHTIGLKIKYEAGKVEKSVAKMRLDAKRAAGRTGVTEAARQKLLEDAEQKVQRFSCAQRRRRSFRGRRRSSLQLASASASASERRRLTRMTSRWQRWTRGG